MSNPELTCINYTVGFSETDSALCDPHCPLRTIKERLKRQKEAGGAMNEFLEKTNEELSDEEYDQAVIDLIEAKKRYEELCTRLSAFTNN